MHLWCDFHVSRPLFDEAQLDPLQAVINEHLPQWSSELRVGRYEDSKGLLVGRDDRLRDVVFQAAPPRRRLGSATLKGADKALSFFIDHFAGSSPPDMNGIGIELWGKSTMEGLPAAIWARGIFEAVTARLPIHYGRANINQEFDAKNMVNDEAGTWAIGTRIADAIPGLYWLNFFGAPLVRLLGRERLLTAPAYEVKAVNEGVLLSVDASPGTWDTAAYREQEEQIVSHLGKQYFFSRHDPDRQTIAADFRA